MPDEYYLCFNCGFITEAHKWKMVVWDEVSGSLIEAPPGYEDPISQCPVCEWDHIDDPGNPGFMNGPASVLTVERQKALADWGERWQDTEKAVFGL